MRRTVQVKYPNFLSTSYIQYQNRYHKREMLIKIITLLTLLTICSSQQQSPTTLQSKKQVLTNNLQQVAQKPLITPFKLPLALPNSQTQTPHLLNGSQIKQVQYKLEPFINQYVIAIIFNKNEELFAIEGKNGTPSWIFLDEDVKEHQTCFEDIYNVDFFYDNNQQQQKENNQPQNNVADEDSKIESFVCLQVQPIKCMGLCKKLGQLTTQDKNKQYITGSNLYEVQLESMDYSIKKSFISVSQFTVKSFHEGLQSTDEINFAEYWVRDFYASIIGQINIEDFSYMIMSHHKEGDNYYYISDRDSFDDIPAQDIVHVGTNTSKTKISIQDKTIIQKPLKYQIKFNSSELAIGLPEKLYNSINKYILEQIFESKCTETLQVLTSKLDKSKQLEQSMLSFCIDEGKDGVNCVELRLSEIVVMWDQEQQQANTEEYYQYFYMIGKEVESETITFYPEFSVIYKVLVKKGDIFGFVRHQTQQINHLKQKKQKKQDEHEHHEHVVEQAKPTTTNTTLKQNQQQQTSSNNYWGGWPIVLIFVVILALFVFGYGCYKFMNEGNQGQIGEAEEQAEQGDLIDGKGKGRKKIFEKPVESVQMIATNQNIVSPDSPDSPDSPQLIQSQ